MIMVILFLNFLILWSDYLIMAYKNKHIVTFGLSDKDYELLMFLYRNSYCSSIAGFFRFVLHEYFEFKLRNGNHKVDLNTLNNDVISMRNTLYDFMGVVDKK